MVRPWYVYIAASQAGKLYVGISTDTARRIKEHNTGRRSRFAQQNGELSLIYVSAPLENQSIARKREIELKSWSREKKLKLIASQPLATENLIGNDHLSE